MLKSSAEMRIEIPQLPGRDLVHSDKKRREAQTKGQVAKIGNLLFCLGLHRLFAHRYNVLSILLFLGSFNSVLTALLNQK